MTGHQQIIEAIDSSPLNRGLKGVDWLASPDNVSFIRDGDITLFDSEGADTYQIHILYKSSGNMAVRSARIAISWLFDRCGAEVIFGMVPEFQRHVKLIARWSGMKSVGQRETPFGPCEMFVLSKDMWKGADA